MSTSACAGVMGGGRSVAHPLIITHHHPVGCNNALNSASLLPPAALPAVSAIQYTPVASSEALEKHTDAESASTSHICITSFSSLYPILISSISSSISLSMSFHFLPKNTDKTYVVTIATGKNSNSRWLAHVRLGQQSTLVSADKSTMLLPTACCNYQRDCTANVGV